MIISVYFLIGPFATAPVGCDRAIEGKEVELIAGYIKNRTPVKHRRKLELQQIHGKAHFEPYSIMHHDDFRLACVINYTAIKLRP